MGLGLSAMDRELENIKEQHIHGFGLFMPHIGNDKIWNNTKVVL